MILALASPTANAASPVKKTGKEALARGTRGAGILAAAADRLNLAGAAVIIVRETDDGPVDLVRQYVGSYSRDTRVPVASVTKLFTAVTLVSMADARLLSLDAPIAECLPNAPQSWAGMTIRQALSHTSGLPGLPPGREIRFSDLASSVSDLRATPLIAPPGSAFAYSGTAYQVAARCAELAGKENWRSAFARRVAIPLRLLSTSYHGDAAPLTGGGLVTTPHDVERFARMLLGKGELDGRRVLSASAVRDMFKVVAPNVPIRARPQLAGAMAGTATGAWCEHKDPSGNCTSIAAVGAFGSYVWVDFARRTYGVFLVQTNPAQIMPVWKALRSAVQ